MTSTAPDRAFECLVRRFAPQGDAGLVDIRRSGDEAVLVFRWPPHRDLFGVPVSLTRTDRRLDWDRPAVDLEDWLDSVDLWLMEDVENGFLWRASRRRLADGYIELRGPEWPEDRRFFIEVVDLTDRDSRLCTDFIARDGLHPDAAAERFAESTLIAWVRAYENNSTGMPYVGHATVVQEGPTVARLEFLEVIEDAPTTLVLDLVRAATHAAADTGVATVVTELDLEHLDVAGFRATGDGQMAVDTRFLEEDPEAAEVLLREALSVPGLWGRDRDRAGRHLPPTRLGRLLHRLRYGSSGSRPRVYVRVG